MQQRPPLPNPFVIPRSAPPIQPSRTPSTVLLPPSQPDHSHPRPPPAHSEGEYTAAPPCQPIAVEGFSQAFNTGGDAGLLGLHGPARAEGYHPVEGGKPISAQELLMRNKGKTVPTASDRILSAIKGLSGQVSSLEGQIASLQSTYAELKGDSNHIRNQLHELHLGQRSLATKEEVADEVANQISMTIPDAVQSYSDKTVTVIKQLPVAVAEVVMLKMDETLKDKEVSSKPHKERDDTSISPLSNLLTHLITKLGAVEQISDSCRILQNLPQAIGDISTYRLTVDRLIRLTEHSLHNPTPPIASTPSSNDQKCYNESLFALKHSLQELHFKLDRSLSSQKYPQGEASTQAAQVATQTGLFKIFEAIKHVFALQTETKGFLQSLVTDKAENSQGQGRWGGSGSSFPPTSNPTYNENLSQTQLATPLSRRPALDSVNTHTIHSHSHPSIQALHYTQRMAPPTPGLTNRLTSAHSTSTGTAGIVGCRGHPTSQPTSQGTSQGTSVGGGPLVGDSVADIFGLKRYIPGPVRVRSGVQRESEVMGEGEGGEQARSTSPFPRNASPRLPPLSPFTAPAPPLVPSPSEPVAPLQSEESAPPVQAPPAPAKRSHKKKVHKKKPRLSLCAATAGATTPVASRPQVGSASAKASSPAPAVPAPLEALGQYVSKDPAGKPKKNWPISGTRPQTRLSSQAQSQSETEREKTGQSSSVLSSQPVGSQLSGAGAGMGTSVGEVVGPGQGMLPASQPSRSMQRNTRTSTVAHAAASPQRGDGSPVSVSAAATATASASAPAPGSMAEKRAAVSAREFAKMEETQQRLRMEEALGKGRKRTWDFVDDDD